MEYTTKIKHNERKDGDVIFVPDYDFICVVKDAKLYQLPEMNEIIPDENWECFRIDFKFISDGSWFVEGSEAYPTVPIDDNKDLWTATFVGLTNKSYNVFKGEHPRWVKEFHPINKFKIEKR